MTDSRGSRPITGFNCSIAFYVLVLFIPVIVIPTCDRLR